MERRRTNGFTLVEMLTVMVIAGILIGLAIPAVTSLMSSGGVSAGSREVANTFGLARQVAITQRTYARVVFPYYGTVGTISRPDMWYRTYAVMTNRNIANVNGWTYMTKWEYLPLGAVFLRQTLPSPLLPLPAGGGALDDQSSLNGASLPFPISGPAPVLELLAYIEFGPTGAASPLSALPGASSVLAVSEGFTTFTTVGNTGTVTPTASRTSTNTLANLTLISVDTMVGRVQVAR